VIYKWEENERLSSEIKKQFPYKGCVYRCDGI